jgi:hypothetical protein
MSCYLDFMAVIRRNVKHPLHSVNCPCMTALTSLPKSFPTSSAFVMPEVVDLVRRVTKAISIQESLFSEILW